MNRIREFRDKAQLSQVRLGILSQIPSSMISDFELGKRIPWPKARKALADALHVTEAELFPNGKEG
jgi:transcriptional regulator with XRE-family HTH domain